MDALAESIRESGILTPLIVRPIENTDEYEVISGHRRLHAAQKAGVSEVPALIYALDRDAAAIAVVDSNLHREHILPSEKAFACKLKLEALKHQGQRKTPEEVLVDQMLGVETSRQVVGKLEVADMIASNESGRQVQRYIRLTCLIPELLQKVDEGKIALTRAVDANVCVAGDMTTLGQPVSADGPMTDAFLFEVYTRQAKALEAAGVDLFAVETMLGCTETAVALEAIRSVSQKPVLCTLTVEADGRTFFGDDAVETAQVLQTLGADAVGVNCSCGPAGLVAVVRRLHQAVHLPIVCKPNAGMPTIGNDGAAHYDLTPAEFARQMLEIRAAGAAILGGCCGTTPAHIRALHEALQDPLSHLR